MAFEQAQAEGLSFFWAHMHVGHTCQFVGNSWEDGGFTTDDDGSPAHDTLGNTVAKFSVEGLDSSNAQHVEQVKEWWWANGRPGYVVGEW